MLEWALFRGVAIAFLILANSFFVAAELALVSVRETRIQQLIAQGRSGASTVLKLKQTLDEFLPAVQFGVTLASLALGWIGEPMVAQIFEGWMIDIPHVHLYAHLLAIPAAFLLITYFTVLLGELVPKALALQRPEQIALAVAGPMDLFIRMTRPAVTLMNRSAGLVLRLFNTPMRGEAAAHSPEELKMIATATRKMGLLPAFQEEIIHRAIELNYLVVREIMTPRRRIFSLPADMLIEQASARIVEEQHSRVPVYDPAYGPEHIIGIVYSKDISRLMHFRMMTARNQDPERQVRTPFIDLRLQQVMRDALVMPETKLVADLLQEFQKRRRQMAIVVDEFGTTVGLVTAEDALEQIVGELEDEFDIAAKPVLSTASGALVLDGSVNLRDLETQMQWKLPRDAGVDSLAGFVLVLAGHIPEPEESVQYGGRRFTVVEMLGHRISRIRVEPLDKMDAGRAQAELNFDGAGSNPAPQANLPGGKDVEK
jgi:CBS domain containing-hemolysin-like protein